MNDHEKDSSMAEGTAVIQGAIGLHARPAVKLTKSAKQFNSQVLIRSDHMSTWVNAKSPNSVMKMKAVSGEILHIFAEGADAQEAVKTLIELIETFDS